MYYTVWRHCCIRQPGSWACRVGLPWLMLGSRGCVMGLFKASQLNQNVWNVFEVICTSILYCITVLYCNAVPFIVGSNDSMSRRDLLERECSQYLKIMCKYRTIHSNQPINCQLLLLIVSLPFSTSSTVCAQDLFLSFSFFFFFLH